MNLDKGFDQMTDRSPLNQGRTLARNRRKQARSEENRNYRASLHKQKDVAGSVDAKNTIQNQINEISNRK